MSATASSCQQWLDPTRRCEGIATEQQLVAKNTVPCRKTDTEVRLRNVSVAMAILERPSTKCGNNGVAQHSWSRKLVECLRRFWDRGEELVFRELDQRFPDKVAADRMGEAMEEAFRLKVMKNETTETFTGRSRLVFARLQTEGVNLP